MKKSCAEYCLVVAFIVMGLPAFGKEWLVSPSGAEGAYPSLEAARDAIRAYRRSHPDDEAHTVVLEDGSYRLPGTLELTRQDSGSAGYPVTYRARNQGRASVTTGHGLSPDLFRATTPEEQARLKPVARKQVLVADIADPAVIEAFGPGQGDYGLLTWDEYVLQLAQWPNRGYNHLDKVYNIGPTWRWLKADEEPAPFSYEEPCGGKFSMEETFDLAAWRNELKRTRDILQDGYLSVDWTKEENMVARVSEDGIIQLLDSSRYGIGDPKNKDRKPEPDYRKGKEPGYKNRRLVFKNILCELDMPGEWYFDRQEQKLYLWPLDSGLGKARIAVPGGPLMVRLTDAGHIRFEGILFENGGDDVLAVEAGDHVTFAGCTFRNLKGRVGVVGGSHTGFQSCDFYNMDTCLVLASADVKNLADRSNYTVESESIRTLTRSNNFMDNCLFHDFRDVSYGAVALLGCGIRFSNNLYYHINSGIWYAGMYIDLKNNEFYEVGIGMGDWNVIYQGGNIWCNGNRVANNFFHHMFQTPSMHGVIAVRNDDGGSGTTYESNIFYKTGCGGVVAMGPSCHIKNNIVLETTTIWRTNKRPITPDAVAGEYQKIQDDFESGKYPRGDKADRIYNAEIAVGKDGWTKEPCLSAFPDFAKYMESNPFAQSYSSLVDNYSNLVDEDDPYNVIYIHGSFQLTDDDGVLNQTDKMDIAFPDSFKHNPPRKIGLADFLDYRSLDFRLKPGLEASPDFKPCDVTEVGLYRDAFRTSPPDKKTYRKRLYEKHKFRPSDPKGLAYNQKTAYKMYPVQSWLKEEPMPWAPYPYLSGLEDIGRSARVVRRDTNYRGGSIVINGTSFKHGLLTYPDEKRKRAEIRFDLTEYPRARRLAATIGLDDATGNRGSCVFEVHAERDGQWAMLYQSPKRTGKDAGLDIRVDLQDYVELKLVVTDAGDGTANDHAAWADARFTE